MPINWDLKDVLPLLGNEKEEHGAVINPKKRLKLNSRVSQVFINCLRLILLQEASSRPDSPPGGRPGKVTLISQVFLFTWQTRRGAWPSPRTAGPKARPRRGRGAARTATERPAPPQTSKEAVGPSLRGRSRRPPRGPRGLRTAGPEREEAAREARGRSGEGS